MANLNNQSPSFIPKKQTKATRQRVRINAYSLASYIILLLVVLMAGGLYGVNYWLEREVRSIVDEVGTVEEAFPHSELEYFRRIDTRATTGRQLLEKNLRSDRVFPLLTELTPVNVQYRDFSYTAPPGGRGEIRAEAITDSFGAVAFQFMLFQESDRISSFNLENLALSEDEIRFDVQATINFSELSYFE